MLCIIEQKRQKWKDNFITEKKDRLHSKTTEKHFYKTCDKTKTELTWQNRKGVSFL